MIRLPCAILVAATLGTAAQASDPAASSPDSRLKAAFGNTIISTYPDGRKASLWLEPGGSYRGVGRRGKPSSGSWTVKGEQICLKQSRPIPMPVTYCTAIAQGGVGTRWTGKAVTGEPIKLELVPGRVGAGTSVAR